MKQAKKNTHQLLIELANAARDCHNRLVSDHPDQARIKSDGSLVTHVDLAIEECLRTLVEQHCPEDFICGEEYGYQGIAGDGWVIDPIDGTNNLACGVELYGTLIAKLKDAVPTHGVLEMSALNKRWIADSSACIHFSCSHPQGVQCAVSDRNKLSDLRMTCSTTAMFTQSELQAFQRVADACQVVIYGTQCYAYGLLATGCVDLVVESDLKPHDFLAVVPIVQAAGGVITDWQGKPLDLNSGPQLVASNNQATHDQILALL